VFAPRVLRGYAHSTRKLLNTADKFADQLPQTRLSRRLLLSQ